MGSRFGKTGRRGCASGLEHMERCFTHYSLGNANPELAEAASHPRRDSQGWRAWAAIGTLRRDWPERKMVVTLENSLAVSHKGVT